MNRSTPFYIRILVRGKNVLQARGAAISSIVLFIEKVNYVN